MKDLSQKNLNQNQKDLHRTDLNQKDLSQNRLNQKNLNQNRKALEHKDLSQKKQTLNDPRTYRIIGAAMEVHRHLGCGFLEPVYQAALMTEFSSRGIPFNPEVKLPVFYKEIRLNTPYKVDFICFDEIIVELKALRNLSGTEEAQVLNYLKASDNEIGLLLNFGTRSLEYRRFIFSRSQAS